jgi:uncharacterized protein
MQSSVAFGWLRHRRRSPVVHEFRYPVYMALLQLDQLDQLCSKSPLLSHNQWNVLSFFDRDHMVEREGTLRERLCADAAAEGYVMPDGPIFLLTNLRHFGYVFNPISIWYCCNAAGQVELLCAEVNNTFGQTRNYWLRPARSIGPVDKTLHVSPFNPMDLQYRFVLPQPAATLLAHIDVFRGTDRFFDATLQMDCQPWSGRALHSSFLRFPLMTMKVVASIHWQALKLFLKRAPFYTLPAETASESEKVSPT